MWFFSLQEEQFKFV